MQRFLFCCVLALTVDASAQVSSKRYVDVSVTDPLGRFVTNIEPSSFEIVENGVRRPVTAFSEGGSLSIAVVSDQPLPTIPALGPKDELIQASSVADALQRLAGSKNLRKVIMFLAPADTQAIPAGIQTVQADRAMLPKWAIELRHQYRLEFDSSRPSASVEVVFKPTAGLPELKLNWK